MDPDQADAGLFKVPSQQVKRKKSDEDEDDNGMDLMYTVIEQKMRGAVLGILHRGDKMMRSARTCPLYYKEVEAAIRYAARLRDKDILLEAIRYRGSGYKCFRHVFNLAHWTKPARLPRLLHVDDDTSSLSWVFHTLFREEKELAMQLALCYPSKTLIRMRDWKTVVPDLELSLTVDDFVGLADHRFHNEILHLCRHFPPPYMASLKEWCAGLGFAKVVLYLAVTTDDWGIVIHLAREQPRINIHLLILQRILKCMSRSRRVSMIAIRKCKPAALLLHACPLNDATLNSLQLGEYMEPLFKSCTDEDFGDWAFLLFSRHQYTILQHLRQRKNPTELNSLLRTLLLENEWKIALEVLPMCKDTTTLKIALRRAFFKGWAVMAEQLIDRVDASTVMFYRGNQVDTLMSVALIGSVRDFYPAHKLLSLCVSSGLSTFQVNSRIDLRRALLRSRPLFKVIKLVVGSGACSQAMLHNLLKCYRAALMGFLNPIGEEHWCSYRYIKTAACTPRRLEYMSRLVVSHCIGCQPGRSQRIEALPIPGLQKDCLRFQDVLNDDEALS